MGRSVLGRELRNKGLTILVNKEFKKKKNVV
jgi:hypothetical protein